jgi:hypothetical protein
MCTNIKHSCLFLKHNTSTLYDSSFENETHNFKIYDCLSSLSLLQSVDTTKTVYELGLS